MSFTRSSHSLAKNRRVMAFGTFDLFHPGHIHYLTEAARHGDELVVVIARDTRVAHGKGRHPIHDELSRKKSVEKVFPDATVILGDVHDIFAPIREYAPHILAFGYDQRVPEEKIHELFPAVEIVRIGGYEVEKWKSSKLRDSL